MKYKLINTKTKEEHLCNKITIDGFDYYVSGEIIKDVRQYKGKWQIEKGYILNKFPTYLTDLSDCRLITATTNPNIDIPKVVNEVEKIAEEWFLINGYNQFDYIHSHIIPDAITTNKLFKTGYNKSQQTHPFSEEDMIEFTEWINENQFLQYADKLWSSSLIEYSGCLYTTKELLQFWKEQQPKIVYYDK